MRSEHGENFIDDLQIRSILGDPARNFCHYSLGVSGIVAHHDAGDDGGAVPVVVIDLCRGYVELTIQTVE